MNDLANSIFEEAPQLSDKVELTAPTVDQKAAIDDEMSQIRPIPRVSVQAFCDSPEFSALAEQLASDRRMAKAHLKVYSGGIRGAAEFYSQAPTPNLLILESRSGPEELLAQLDELSVHCDPGTKVLVIGQVNDVVLYRELIMRGVSEYLVLPVSMPQLLNEISAIFVDPAAEPLGRFISFIGARGGVGSSTIAHNVAWHMSTKNEDDVVLADLDIAFGTANIDFNQDPAQTIADAVFSPDRLDETYVDRILSKHSERLSLLTAPATLDRPCDFQETTFDGLMDLLQVGVPQIVLDLPHGWTSWTQHLLSRSDEVVVTATPDLASVRNTKLLLDKLESLRPNDKKPTLVLNQVGVPKRPEIAAAEFIATLNSDSNLVDAERCVVIDFQAELFGEAANNGEMISELDAGADVVTQFDELAAIVTGRKVEKQHKKSGGFLKKLGLG